jgi:cytochrome c oxidase cbb3-type subunit 3
MKALKTWFDRRSRRVRISLLAGAGIVSLAMIVLAGATALNGRLLRIYADDAPEHPILAAYAEARAAPVYQTHCASCHGPDLQGDTMRGTPRLADADWLYGEGKVAEIEQIIRYGVRSGHAKSRNLADMPAFAREHPYVREKLLPLSPEQIRDVIEFLRDKQAKDHDPAAAVRGEEVWRKTGGCYDCHGEDAGGDGSVGAPNLDDAIWLHGDGSRQSMFNQISFGMAGVCPAWFDRLTPGEIRSLAVFIHDRALHPKAPRT